MNYVMLNGMVGVGLVLGILFVNDLWVVFGCLGKVGYFPFYVVLGYQYYSCSYLWIVLDVMNK
jgi:hypothetical protein